MRIGCTCEPDCEAPCTEEEARCQGARRTAPSLSRVQRLSDLTNDEAGAIWGLISGDLDPYEDDRLSRYAWWEGDLMRNRHRTHATMLVIDKILRTHGVESECLSADPDDGPWATYCNTGDMYARTVVEFQGEYYLASWEDLRLFSEKMRAPR